MDRELVHFLRMMNNNMKKGFADVKKQLSEVNRKLDILDGRVTRGFDETATLIESADKHFITLTQSDINF